MKSILTAWYIPWIILGIVVRVILSIVTLHPDIFALSIVPTFFSYHGVWNVYSYLDHLTPATSLFAKNIGTSDVFIYPPLAYYTLGVFNFLLRPFTDVNFYAVLLGGISKTINNPGVYSFLFFAKLPYLLFDLGSLYFITNIFSEYKQRRLAFFLWLFNPVSLYASFMIGNFDAIPVFFTILGLYLLFKKQLTWGFLLFGIAAAYKTYPLLLALPLLFHFGETVQAKVKYFICLISPFVLSSIPFLTTAAYRRDVLFNPKNTKFLYMSLPLTGAEVLYIFMVGVVLITFAAVYYKRAKDQFWIYPLSVLLLFYSVTSYHPQWFLWITPFLVIPFVLYKWTRWPIVLLLVLYLFVIFFFESSLNIGIFSPLLPQTVHAMSATELLIKHFSADQVNQWKSLIRSIFAGIAFAIILTLLFSQNHARESTANEKSL